MEQNLDNTQTVESEKQEAAHEQQEQRERTFTQTEVNGLVARESKSAVEKLLKSAGIAPEGDYKASPAVAGKQKHRYSKSDNADEKSSGAKQSAQRTARRIKSGDSC